MKREELLLPFLLNKIQHMALNLDFLVVPTYDKYTMAVMDTSTYVVAPTTPLITITVPLLTAVDIVFTPNVLNVFNSETLGLTATGEDLIALPDGVYVIKYSIDPPATNYIEKDIMRTDRIQEKFDEAFMKLDMMECDKAIKTQSKVDLNTIYFLIQGSMAAANNCAIVEANKLYQQAVKALNSFIKNNCGCQGNNYVINFS